MTMMSHNDIAVSESNQKQIKERTSGALKSVTVFVLITELLDIVGILWLFK